MKKDIWKQNGKWISVTFLAIIIMIGFTLSTKYRVVYIKEDDLSKKVISFTDNTDWILDFYQIPLSQHDKVQQNIKEDHTIHIEITRARTISIKADGEIRSVPYTNEKVEDVLLTAGIPLYPEDIITPNMKTSLEENAKEIEIKRVTYEELENMIQIPSPLSYEYSPLYKPHEETVLSKGASGQVVQRVRHKKVDGEIVETHTLSENTIAQATPTTVLKGKENHIISPLEFGKGRSESVPPQAKLFQKGAVATAYSARKGAKTASGRDAIVGHVAVNPQEIPYGTKLYITSSNGRFVYGYAIAADTGGFVQSGNADIDLFFNSKEESKRFGKQAVDIYLVE